MTPITRRRLFGVLAHVDAGKTTVSERLLFFSGRIHRMGEVHHGNTALDHTAEERKHGITITAAATTTTWREHTLSLIDTPGHVDFAVEVERSLRVLDGAIVVLDASRGVEPQTESVWRQADRHQVPRIVFVNKLDAPGASIERCLRDLHERLGVQPIALQALAPDGTLIDLVEALDEDLIETLAEFDAALLEAWVRGAKFTPNAVRAALRRACLSRHVVPVLCGAALDNLGIEPLLDGVVHYLPSPADRVLPEGLRPDADAPVCGFVFKTEVDPHLGTLAWTRVFQGTVTAGQALTLRPGNRVERVSRVLGLHGGKLEPMTNLPPGGIAAVAGLKSARTGSTLCASGLEVELEGVIAAEPMVELAVSVRTAEEQARLGEALRKACFEDPSLAVRVDEETGQTVLCGVGELHLSIWLEKLERREGLVVKTGAPQVAYRDTLRGEATVTLRHVRQSGGPGQFAVVTLRVRPLERGAGFVFIDETKGGVVPAPFVEAVKLGARAAMSRGVREGVPLVDCEVVLLDGQTHPRDSSAAAFEVAGSLAVQNAAQQAGLLRLEPMTAATVHVPESSLGAVLGELTSRRAMVNSVEVITSRATVRASLPLERTFGLVTALRSRSEGRADASFTVGGYEVVTK